MRYFFITIYIFMCGVTLINTGNASNSNDFLYRNLYHSGVTSGDIFHARRIITRQIRINPTLIGCTKQSIPIPVYSFTNPEQGFGLYWFLSCVDSNGIPYTTNTVFEFIMPELRRGYYDSDKRAKNAINTNTAYIFQEYNSYPDATVIQYISSNYGHHLLIRDNSGHVIDSKNMWLNQYPDKNFEISTLKGILGDKW